MNTGYLFVALMSALSLAVGLAASSSVNHVAQEVSKALGADLVLVQLGCGVVVFIGLLFVASVLSRLISFLARKAIHEKVRVTANSIMSELATFKRELDMEVRFDSKAKIRLTEAATRVDDCIMNAISCPGLARVRRWSPSFWSLLVSMCRHGNVEAAMPLVEASATTIEQTKELVKRSSWGVGCVHLLHEQLGEGLQSER